MRRRYWVNTGEIHILPGESGAGKITLMNIFSELHRRDSDEIIIGDRMINFLSLSGVTTLEELETKTSELTGAQID